MDGALIPFWEISSTGRAAATCIGRSCTSFRTREFVNLPFGGPIDNIEDPETGLAVGLRVFGEYALSVVDPATLILTLVGTRQVCNDLVTDWTRDSCAS